MMRLFVRLMMVPNIVWGSAQTAFALAWILQLPIAVGRGIGWILAPTWVALGLGVATIVLAYAVQLAFQNDDMNVEVKEIEIPEGVPFMRLGDELHEVLVTPQMDPRSDTGTRIGKGVTQVS